MCLRPREIDDKNNPREKHFVFNVPESVHLTRYGLSHLELISALTGQ